MSRPRNRLLQYLGMPPSTSPSLGYSLLNDVCIEFGQKLRLEWEYKLTNYPHVWIVPEKEMSSQIDIKPEGEQDHIQYVHISFDADTLTDDDSARGTAIDLVANVLLHMAETTGSDPEPINAVRANLHAPEDNYIWMRTKVHRHAHYKVEPYCVFDTGPDALVLVYIRVSDSRSKKVRTRLVLEAGQKFVTHLIGRVEIRGDKIFIHNRNTAASKVAAMIYRHHGFSVPLQVSLSQLFE